MGAGVSYHNPYNDLHPGSSTLSLSLQGLSVRVRIRDYSAMNVIGSKRKPWEMLPKITSLMCGIVSYIKRTPKIGRTTNSIVMQTEESIISSASMLITVPLRIRKGTFDVNLIK